MFRKFILFVSISAAISACGPSSTVHIPSEDIPDSATLTALGTAIVDKGTASLTEHPGKLEAACRRILDDTIFDANESLTKLEFMAKSVNYLTSPHDQHVVLSMLKDISEAVQSAFTRIMIPNISNDPCSSTYVSAATSVDLIHFGGSAARSADMLAIGIIEAH